MISNQISFKAKNNKQNKYPQKTYNSSYPPHRNNYYYVNNYQIDNFFEKPQNTKKSKVGSTILKVTSILVSLFVGANVTYAGLSNADKFLSDKTPKDSTETYGYEDFFEYKNENYEDNYNFEYTTPSFDTKDSVIGDTEQGSIADCWLLSVINSFNETEKGKDFFANLLEYKDGETIVHLYVGDYTIKDSELKNNKKGKSTGDDDVLIIELAVEKALTDYNNGAITLPEAVITDALGGEGTSSTLNMGTQDAAIYILTGNSSEYLKIKKHEELIDKYFEKFGTSAKENMSITASLEKDTTYCKNSDGEEIKIKGHHAYTVKSINENNIVTITNPDDSSEEIEISYATFKDIFSSVTVADISNIA